MNLVVRALESAGTVHATGRLTGTLISIQNAIAVAPELEFTPRQPRQTRESPLYAAANGNGPPGNGNLGNGNRPPTGADGGNATHGSADGRLWLQDMRDWYAWHSSSCNLPMADGSVKNIKDKNGDGFLNPGFPIFPDNASVETDGFMDNRVELEPFEVYSGPSIISGSLSAKGNFE